MTSLLNTCESCRFWQIERKGPTYATVNGRTMEVAQCMCRDDDRSPYAEILGPFEAAVFTHAESHCEAFEVHPEVAAEVAASAAHYAELNNQLTREAWM